MLDLDLGTKKCMNTYNYVNYVGKFIHMHNSIIYYSVTKLFVYMSPFINMKLVFFKQQNTFLHSSGLASYIINVLVSITSNICNIIPLHIIENPCNKYMVIITTLIFKVVEG